VLVFQLGEQVPEDTLIDAGDVARATIRKSTAVHHDLGIGARVRLSRLSERFVLIELLGQSDDGSDD
jgi:hypothetical protein